MDETDQNLLYNHMENVFKNLGINDVADFGAFLKDPSAAVLEIAINELGNYIENVQDNNVMKT